MSDSKRERRSSLNKIITGGARNTRDVAERERETSQPPVFGEGSRKRTQAPTIPLQDARKIPRTVNMWEEEDEELTVSRRAIEKILAQNAELLKKVDLVLDRQKVLENKIIDLENEFHSNRSVENEKDFVERAVKNISKELIIEHIYPDQEHFREAAEEYFSQEHPEFYGDLSKKRWTTYYEKHLQQAIVKQHRSIRGTLASKIKESMFSVFGEGRLDPINTNSTSSEITAWKKSPKTAKAFGNLFKRIRNDEEFTYMSRIFEKVWSKSEISNEQSAFAIAVCETVLNPATESVKLEEGTIKQLIRSNKRKIERGIGFSQSESDNNDFLEEEVVSLRSNPNLRERMRSTSNQPINRPATPSVQRKESEMSIDDDNIVEIRGD